MNWFKIVYSTGGLNSWVKNGPSGSPYRNWGAENPTDVLDGERSELRRPNCNGNYDFLAEIKMPSGRKDLLMCCQNCLDYLLKNEPEKIEDYTEKIN
jgi:hypothetical protein